MWKSNPCMQHFDLIFVSSKLFTHTHTHTRLYTIQASHPYQLLVLIKLRKSASTIYYSKFKLDGGFDANLEKKRKSSITRDWLDLCPALLVITALNKQICDSQWAAFTPSDVLLLRGAKTPPAVSGRLDQTYRPEASWIDPCRRQEGRWLKTKSPP